jgi:hypothetical protein
VRASWWKDAKRCEASPGSEALPIRRCASRLGGSPRALPWPKVAEQIASAYRTILG